MKIETIVVLVLTAFALVSVILAELHSRRTARATASAQKPEVTTTPEPAESSGSRKKESR